MNITKRHFLSLTELLEQATCEPNEILNTHELHSRTGDVYFTGTKNFEDALAIATGGWEEGRNIISQFTKTYGSVWNKFFPQQDYGQELTNTISGSVPQVDKYLLGDPNSMLEFTDTTEESNLAGCKLQRIILNGGANSSIRPECILQYGALIGALINSMELAGFNVELVICWKTGSKMFGAQNCINPYETTVIRYTLEIKKFQDRLDVDKLAFCVAHSSMLRRFIFALREQESEEYINNIVKNSYGYSINLTSEEITSFGAESSGQLKHGNMYFKLLDDNYSLDQLVEQCTAVVKGHFTEVSFNKEVK